ncbi:MAG TPA: oxidoreductase [Solirubrobacterales bacterium]|jgi:NAD(P)-dependent dehydrogenase (short-subunit alcohol dehydrogenase family)|nr:oxidoreductase [Solirubrobacterales bacterium]
MSEKWTAEQIPDQAGRVAVVTGANSGLGLVTARELARAGAEVVLACRNTDKGEAALGSIREEVPDASVSVEALDLSSLDSVRAFAERFSTARGSLDLLVNNAGLMAPPRGETADGFELQIGTNHLGHFALTGLLLARLEGREDARVVTLTSGAHRIGKIGFDDLQSERRYGRWRAYSQSKLANILFAFELERRLRASDSSVKSLAAHPGYAATNLQSAAPPALDRATMAITNRLFAQSAAMGALPTLYAATRPNLDGGLFIGPDGFEGARGHPKVVRPARAGRDEAVAKRLWSVSEELTGVGYSFAVPGDA